MPTWKRITFAGESSGSFSNLQLDSGSENAPSYSFTGDTNTGMWRTEADGLALGTNGTQALSINSSQTAVFSGDVYIPANLVHSGDGDTLIGFGTNVVQIEAGGTAPIRAEHSLVTMKAGAGVSMKLDLVSDNGSNHADNWRLSAETDHVFEIQTKDGGSWADVIELSSSDKKTYLKGDLSVSGNVWIGNHTLKDYGGDLTIESNGDDINIVGSWLRIKQTDAGAVKSAWHYSGQLTLGADAQTTHMLKVASGTSYFADDITIQKVGDAKLYLDANYNSGDSILYFKNTADNANLWSAKRTSDGEFQIEQDGTDALVFDTSRRAGIGISPSTKGQLSVYGNGLDSLYVKANDHDAIVVENIGNSPNLILLKTNNGSEAFKVTCGGANTGNAHILGNITTTGGQLLTTSGVNLALNPNTGLVTVGGSIKASSSQNVYLSLDTTQTNGDEWKIFNVVSGSESQLQFKNEDTSEYPLVLEQGGLVGINKHSGMSKTLHVDSTTGSAGTPNGIMLHNYIHGSNSQIYMYAENDSGALSSGAIKYDPDASTMSILGSNNTGLSIDSSGNTTLAGTLYVPSTIGHTGDTDNAIIFTTDVQTYYTEGVARLTLTSTRHTSARPIDINTTYSDEQLRLMGTSPYIRFYEGGTGKAYLQWHSDGKVLLENQETSSRMDMYGSLSFYAPNDAGSTEFILDNNAAAGSTDEKVAIRFRHASKTAARILSERTEDFSSSGAESANLCFQTVKDGLGPTTRLLIKDGGDAELYGSYLKLSNATNPYLYINDTSGAKGIFQALDAYVTIGSDSNHEIRIVQNNGTALSFDTSKNATFAGTLNGLYINAGGIGDADSGGTQRIGGEGRTHLGGYIKSYGGNAGGKLEIYSGTSGAGTLAVTIASDQSSTFGGKVTLDLDTQNEGIIIKNTHYNSVIDFHRASTATARIQVHEPGAVHTSALKFYTSDADSSAPNLQVAMMIGSDRKVSAYNGLYVDSGNVEFKGNTLSIGSASGDSYLRLDGASGNTYLHYNHNDIIDVYTGGDIAMRIKDDDVEFNGAATIAGNLVVNGSQFDYFRAVNSGNPEFHMGSSDTNKLHIQTVYDAGAQTLARVDYRTYTASGTADAGSHIFHVDESTKLKIDDGGIEVTGSATFSGGTIGSTIDFGSHGTSANWKAAYDFSQSGGTVSGDVQVSGLYVGSTNTTYDFYNNGSTYLNGATTIDANTSINGDLTVTDTNAEIRMVESGSSAYYVALTSYHNAGDSFKMYGIKGDYLSHIRTDDSDENTHTLRIGGAMKRVDIFTDGTQRLLINEGGDVNVGTHLGVGTTFTDAHLGTKSIHTVGYIDITGNGGLSFNDNSSTGYFYTSNHAQIKAYSAITFTTYGTTYTERMRITSTGVGIGVTPSYKLDVAGTARVGTTAAGGILRLEGKSGVSYPWQLETGTTGGLTFDSNTTDVLTLTDVGRVGVGILGPKTHLDVRSYQADGITIGADNDANRTRTNSTVKSGGITGVHYTNDEESIRIIGYDSTSSANKVYIGGANSDWNAATEIKLYTAANATTVTGTAALTIDSSQNATFAGYIYTNVIFANGSSALQLRSENSKGIEYLSDADGHIFKTYDSSWKTRMTIADDGKATFTQNLSGDAYIQVDNITGGSSSTDETAGIRFSLGDGSALRGGAKITAKKELDFTTDANRDASLTFTVLQNNSWNDAVVISSAANATFSGDVKISSTTPLITLDETDGVAEWQIYGSGNNFYIGESGEDVALFIHENGAVGINTTSANSYHASADNLVIYESANAGMTIATSSTGTGSIFFADSVTGDEAYKGAIEYVHGSTNELQFRANSVKGMTLDASKNLTIFGSYLNINAGGTNSAIATDSDTMHFMADSNANGGVTNPFEWWHDSPTIDGGTKIMHLSASNDLWVANDLTTAGSISVPDGQKVGAGDETDIWMTHSTHSYIENKTGEMRIVQGSGDHFSIWLDNASGTDVKQLAIAPTGKIHIGNGNGIGQVNIKNNTGDLLKHLVLDTGNTQQDWSIGVEDVSNRVNLVIQKEYGDNSWGNALKIMNDGGQVQGTGGSAAKPTYSFIDQASTGMYKPGTSQLYFSVAGTRKVRMEASQIVLEDDVSVNDALTVGNTLNVTGQSHLVANSGNSWTALKTSGGVEMVTSSADSSEKRFSFAMGGASDSGTFTMYNDDGATTGVSISGGDNNSYISNATSGKRLHIGAIDGNAGIKATNTSDSFDHLRLSGYTVKIGHTSTDLVLDQNGNASFGRGTVSTTATNNSAGIAWTAIGDGNIPHISIQNASTTNDTMAGLFFKDDQAHRAGVHARFLNHTDGSEQSELVFSTANNGGTRERFIIGNDGDVSITGGSNYSQLRIKSAGSEQGIKFIDSSNNTEGWVYANSYGIGFLDEGGSWTIKAQNNTGIYFYTNQASQHMQILNSGNVSIGNTNDTYKLDVTGTARFSTGVLFGSDSAAANTLHDYEEGNWTPVFTDEDNATFTASATIASAYYVKVGAQVTVWARIQNITNGDAEDQFCIKGLPFTVEAAHAGGTAMFSGWNFVKTGSICVYVRDDGVMKFFETLDNTAWSPITWSENDSSTNDMNFYATYRTTQ